MTPAEKEQLWNCIMKMRSMPWKGPRGGVNNWTYRDMRKLYDKLVAYGDNNEPNAAWRLLNSGKYKYMIYPWKKGQLYNCITFSPPSGTCFVVPSPDYTSLVYYDDAVPEWGYGTQQISGLAYPITFTWDYTSTTSTMYYRIDNSPPVLNTSLSPSAQGFTSATPSQTTGVLTNGQYLTIGVEGAANETINLNLTYECNGNPGITLQMFTVEVSGYLAKCVYSAYLDPNAYGYPSFAGWTLNGNDLVTELTALMNSYGGDFYYGFADFAQFTFYGGWFYYYDTTDIGPLNIVDPGSNVIPYSFNKNDLFGGFSCDPVCYEIYIYAGTNLKLINSINNGISGSVAVDFTLSPPTFSYIDTDDQITLEIFFRKVYGPQCYVTVLTAGGFDTIRIYDAFDFGPPQLTDVTNNVYTGTYITCP